MATPELELALDAARMASDYLLAAYERFQVIPDAPADISTEADRQSQEIILKTIRAAFPADAISAEETTATLGEVAQIGTRTWIVDPIDGTRGFARKNGEFSVMIGFVADGVIQAGVVAQPAVGRVTYASLGAGCWRVDGPGAAPVRCHTTPVGELPLATLTQSRSREAGKRSKWAEALNPSRIVESYSAGIKLALVARGEADIYLNTYEAFHDWDICAGQILVTEAGGKVTGVNGEPLIYGTPGAWQKNGLLATNGPLHADVCKVIEQIR